MTTMTTNDLPFPLRRIDRYLAELASASPAPGGGSAAGLVGALGCSLGSMVCNLTIARNPDDMLETAQKSFAAMTGELLELAEQDESAFSRYRSATRLPRATEEDRNERRRAIESALVEAARVPLRMTEIGVEALRLLATTAETGTTHALGDLATGGHFLEAMIRGCLENVEANAALMKDPEQRAIYEQAARSARNDVQGAVAELRRALDARASG